MIANNRRRCIFKESKKMGMQVFWFAPLQSSDPVFNAEYVGVFRTETDAQPFVRLHISQILPLGDEVMTEKRLGCIYPTDKFVKALRAAWAS